MRGGVGVTLLHAFLHLVTGITTTDRTSHRGNFLTGTATNLVAQQTTRYCTEYRTGNLMLVLHWSLTCNSHVFAHFARGFDGLLDRLHRQHFCVLRPSLDQIVGGHSTPGGNTDCTQNRTHQH
ncbi:hypothetical protein D3C79_809120 [compost metagenome]